MVIQKLIDYDSALQYQISPYTDVLEMADGSILLKRRDTAKKVRISGATRNTLLQIVDVLSQGTSVATIAEWITSGDLEKAWVDFLVQSGVLE